MERFEIYVENMPKLRKKMRTVSRKCSRYNTAFHFEEVGETLKELKDEKGEKYYARFVIVEAEGKAQINGWRFLATIDHQENGNVIRKAIDVEIPKRYYSCPVFCEHCRTQRSRTHAYLVQNISSGEIKMVGNNCLKDFTNGMSAEGVAAIMSMIESAAEAQEEPICVERCSRYYDTKEYLRYAAETVKRFGYSKTSEPRSTANRAFDYFSVNTDRCPYMIRRTLLSEMENVGFDAESKEIEAYVNNALEWIRQQDESSEYIHNLRTVCLNPYIKYTAIGFAASLIPVYDRHIEREARIRLLREKGKESEYVGAVGERIKISVKEVKLLAQYPTEWGYNRIYHFIDEDGNHFKWKSSTIISHESKVKELVGTVVSHEEYRGVKQTELKRCRVSA